MNVWSMLRGEEDCHVPTLCVCCVVALKGAECLVSKSWLNSLESSHLDVISLIRLRSIFFLSFSLGEITLVGEDT